jgi:DMSO reductase anchor subunit
MCPYEVPAYSERRGIVRKCDMCHQRLAHNEPPACVQACPGEAIRITIVQQSAINPFLPCSPDPAITLPTTRYISAKPLPPDLTAGNSHDLSLAPSHLPLVWMLVLTQFGVGSFLAAPFTSHATQPLLTAAGLTTTILGLAASTMHLGRPQKAWRAFLGLRRSWLSREIIAFACFLLLAAVSFSAVLLHRSPSITTPMLSCAAVFGVLGVFCSAMTYHVTQRECWRGEHSLGRFFSSMILLGSAGASCASAFSSANDKAFTFTLIIASVLKLSREQSFLRLCPDDADLNDEIPATLRARSAFLIRFRAGLVLRLRLACGWLGGVACPLLSLLSPLDLQALTFTSVLLCLAGELAERFLFFRATAISRMPGTANS